MHVNVRALIERIEHDQLELLIQTRDKPYEGGTCLELPGGRVEEFESLIDALRREVREETGLELVVIEGLEMRLETNGTDTNVECLKPFAVYQTLRGPVDSVGFYFHCRAKGQLLDKGDETTHPRWVPLHEIACMMKDDPERFSFVDRAGLAFFLRYSF